MPLPDLVLVHGGEHASDCWDLTVAELRCQEPELRVLAVDLPGRRGKPGDLATATIDEWSESVVTDITQADLGDVIIVGHSMAGITVPPVVGRLGPSKVREMILASAFVPPHGSAIVDSLGGPLAWFARRGVRSGKPMAVPNWVAAYAFCNGMSRAQKKFAVDRLYRESTSVVGERVDRTDLPDAVPRTWILTTRDRALSIRSQRKSIAALGGVETVIPIAACHDVMISHPRWLAATLINRCRIRRSKT